MPANRRNSESDDDTSCCSWLFGTKNRSRDRRTIRDDLQSQNEYESRAHQRRQRALAEEREDRERRERFQAESRQMDENSQYERREANRRFEEEKRALEAERARMEREREQELYEHKKRLQTRNAEEAKRNDDLYNAERARKELEHNQKIQERNRINQAREVEINNLRDETNRKEKQFQEKQRSDKIRRENDDKEFEEKLRKMAADSQRNRENEEKKWRAQMEEQNAQHDYIMRQIEKEKWTMNTKARFNARLAVLRSGSKEIRGYFDSFADSLIVLSEYIRNNNLINQNRYQILKSNAESLRRVVQKQSDTMSGEVNNLQEMHNKFGFPFLLDIQDSLIVVGRNCDQMLYEISSRFSDIDPAYIKSGQALDQMNLLFKNILESYAAIPTMESLDADYRAGSSGNGGRNQHHEENHGYYVEE